MLVIRKATREDVPAIVGLVRELATYEREPDAVIATVEDFVRDGFGEKPAFEVIVAEEAGESERSGTGTGTGTGTWGGGATAGAGSGARVVGFALYFFSYSTWVGRKCLYLEDLFVKPAERGRGAGIALMRELAQIAVARECRRFVWQVLDWNEPAIAFYEKLGATVLREWLTVRVEGQALATLAGAKASWLPVG